jgi:deoxyadenosine/deoxycytidine kinase
LKENYDIIFTERSIYTDKNVFAQMLYDFKKMTNIEFLIYSKWFNEFSDIIENIKTVYIRTLPEICEKRVLKRARPGENIPLDYLKDCHYYHDIWLHNPGQIESGNVLVINGNEETNTSLFIENKYYDELMEKVFKFMK